MSLSQIAWIVVVAICLLVAALLLIGSYYGYAAVSVAIGIAAATNLL